MTRRIQGMTTTDSSWRIALTILLVAYPSSRMGQSSGNLDFAPSNIPVLMKYGQMQVVFTFLHVFRSSILRDSSKPTAPNLDAQ